MIRVLQSFIAAMHCIVVYPWGLDEVLVTCSEPLDTLC